MTSTWRDTIVNVDCTLRDAMQQLDQTGLQIVIACDASGRLAGVVTDGDLRRAVLRSQPMETPIDKIMNHDPLVGLIGESRERHLALMRAHRVRHLPLVDDAHKLCGLADIDALSTPPQRTSAALILAGGRGVRLGPLTQNTPKPMLEVGGRPILEHIVESFMRGAERILAHRNNSAPPARSASCPRRRSPCWL